MSTILFGRGRSEQRGRASVVRGESAPPILERQKRSISSPVKSSRRQAAKDVLIRSLSARPHRSPFTLKAERSSSAPAAIKFNSFTHKLLELIQKTGSLKEYKNDFREIFVKSNGESIPGVSHTVKDIYAYAVAAPSQRKGQGDYLIASNVLSWKTKNPEEEQVRDEALKILWRKNPTRVQDSLKQGALKILLAEPKKAGTRFLNFIKMGAIRDQNEALIILADDVGRRSREEPVISVVKSLEKAGVELNKTDRPSFVSTLREMPYRDSSRLRDVAPLFLSDPLQSFLSQYPPRKRPNAKL